MPRSTRRSEEPSAAEESIVPGDDAIPLETSPDPSVTESVPSRRTRTTTSRRRAPAKVEDTATPSASPSDNDEATSAAQPEPRPRRRRSPRPAAVAASAPVESTDDVVEEFAEPVDLDIVLNGTVEIANPSRQSAAPTVRRRVGGRRTSLEAATALGETLPETPVVSSEPPARSSRNRRRRGGSRAAEPSIVPTVQPELIPGLDSEEELLEIDAVVELPAEEIIATEDEQRRSRRSRRGGRRRSGRGADAEKGVEAETELLEEEIEEDDPLIPLFKPTQVWSAPELVPHPAALELEQVDLKVDAALAADLSGFIINGSYFPPELFFVNGETADDEAIVSSQIALAAEAGVHLHSGVAYLPLKNAYGVRSFVSVEKLLNTVIAADADAHIIIRLQLVPTNFWARTHPDEMAKYSDGSDGDVSFASRIFWQDAVDAIGALLQFLSSSETVGGDRVIGIHLDKGEWFNDASAGYDLSAPNKSYFQSWLHERYQNVFALRAAWFSGTSQFETSEIPKWPGIPTTRKKEEVVLYSQPRERKFVDYNAYTSDVMGLAIAGVARAVKWLSKGKLLVGTSYGYSFEFAARNDSGHQSLYRVLQSPDIDVIAGPNSYSTRAAGSAGGFGSPVDSAKLHSKIWFVEDDTKTHLAGDETEDSFNPKVSTIGDTVAVLRRNAAAAAVHGCGIIWMDLWGKGWLNSQELWSEIADLRAQAGIGRTLKASDAVAVPEVAILVDEASYSYVRGDGAGVALQTAMITKSRELIYRSGASVGFYLQSDIALLPDKIKLFIFLNALRVTTAERQAIREKLQVQGKTLVWIYGPGVFDERGESPAEVSEIVGMPLKAQPWSSHIGTIFTEERHPITERLHGGKRLGTDDVLNPSYAVVDPAAIVLGEYSQTGAPSIASKINEGGWKSVFIGEPHLTGELLRGIYRFAGIHVYDSQDDIVHVLPNGLLLAHAPYTGQRTVHLPKPSAVYSLFEKRLVTQSSSTFRAFMRGRTTNFFLWGDIDQIASAVGSTADELREQQLAWKNERDANQQRGQRGGNDGGREEAESESPYGTSLEADSASDGAGAPSDGTDFTPNSLDLTAGSAKVDLLVKSGLIADETDVELDGAGDLDLDDVEGGAPASVVRPAEQMSPSRRRRWNRKRNMQAAKEPGPPAISMEDLLSDLPPRKSTTPKTDE